MRRISPIFASRCPLMLCVVMSIAVVGPLGKLSAQDWRNGQSNWNGSGYEVLPTPIPQPSGRPTPSPDSLPPTSPSPSLAPTSITITPDQWDREFGMTDAPGISSPAIGSGAIGERDLNSAGVLPVPPGLSMGSAIAEGQSLDTPPLEEEVLRWYQIPWRWISKGWSNNAEFGLDGNSGNSNTLAIQTGLEMKRKTEFDTLALDIDYRRASANNLTTADNGRLNLDYDRLLGETSWTAFGKFGMEFDQFKAFDLRLNANSGFGYYWLRNDRTNFITRFGAGASKEIGAPNDATIPEAVFGVETDHQISARQKIKAKLEYFPAWNDFSNYRMVSDVAWETLLDNSDNLSLRLSFTDRYDSTPQGAKPNDFYYGALLLYKF